MSIEPQTRITRAPNLMSTQIDDEIVILNMATDNYIALDVIGLRIWELLEAPCTLDEICKQLEQEFSGDPEQIRADVLAFLDELQTEEMLNILT